jgi:hypothetical protein
MARQEALQTPGKRGAMKASVAVLTAAVLLVEIGMPPFSKPAEASVPVEESRSAESSARNATPSSAMSVREAERASQPHAPSGPKKKRRGRFRRALEKIVHPWK